MNFALLTERASKLSYMRQAKVFLCILLNPKIGIESVPRSGEGKKIPDHAHFSHFRHEGLFIALGLNETTV